MPQPIDARALLENLVARARRAGADAADAVLFEGVSLSHAQRLGNTEKLERSESYDLGLRVLVGQRQAIVSSNDRGAERFDELVARAVAMAKAVPEDPYCGLASPDEIARNWPDLDMVDTAEPNEAIANVMVLDATWSAIHPSVTRPSMLVVCITAKTRPAVLSDWPSATTR